MATIILTFITGFIVGVILTIIGLFKLLTSQAGRRGIIKGLLDSGWTKPDDRAAK